MTPIRTIAAAATLTGAALTGLVAGGAPALAQDDESPFGIDFLIAQCDSPSADERDACLAGLAMRENNPAVCDSAPGGRCRELAARVGMDTCAGNHQGGERVECEMAIVTNYPAPDACAASLDPSTCIVVVAAELQQPNLIAERIVNEQEMQRLMASYVAMAHDLRGLDYITDPFFHDGALTYGAAAVGYGSDRELGADYCARLKGGYGAERGTSARSMEVLCRFAVRVSNAALAREQSSEGAGFSDEDDAAFLAELQRSAEQLEADAIDSGETDEGDAVERGGPSADAGGKYCERIYSYACPDDDGYAPFYDSGRWGGGSDCGETDLPAGYYVYFEDTWYVYSSVCETP